MAKCGALRGVARLGQVVASWGPLIIFKVPLSERDMQAECGGWHSSTSWAVAAACNSHTVQLLSVLHDAAMFFPRHR